MYHKLITVGHLGKDPEMKYHPNGQAVTSFSIATSRKYKSGNGELLTETIWERVSVWGKAAEACNQYLKKGSLVLVEGRLSPDKITGAPRIWTKQDGTPATSFEVTALEVKFLSGAKTGEVMQAETPDGEEQGQPDFPF